MWGLRPSPSVKLSSDVSRITRKPEDVVPLSQTCSSSFIVHRSSKVASTSNLLKSPYSKARGSPWLCLLQVIKSPSPSQRFSAHICVRRCPGYVSTNTPTLHRGPSPSIGCNSPSSEQVLMPNPLANTFLQPDDKFWSLYLKDAHAYDKVRMERWKGDADGILIFVRRLPTA